MISSSRRQARRAALLMLLGLLGGVLGGLLAAPAGAAQNEQSEWEIRSFEAVIVIAEDGSLQITETIAVTFHVPSRGILREIPFRVPVDSDTVRRYDFDQLAVQTTPGAPDDLHQERAGDFLVWRVGDPDVSITGDHTYVLSYRVRGALNRFDTHDELFWNVTGDRWRVPIQQTTAIVQAPAITEVSCFAGRTGQTDPCAGATHDERSATFTAWRRGPSSMWWWRCRPGWSTSRRRSWSPPMRCGASWRWSCRGCSRRTRYGSAAGRGRAAGSGRGGRAGQAWPRRAGWPAGRRAARRSRVSPTGRPAPGPAADAAHPAGRRCQPLRHPGGPRGTGTPADRGGGADRAGQARPSGLDDPPAVER